MWHGARAFRSLACAPFVQVLFSLEVMSYIANLVLGDRHQENVAFQHLTYIKPGSWCAQTFGAGTMITVNYDGQEEIQDCQYYDNVFVGSN